MEPLAEVPVQGVYAPERTIEPGGRTFRLEIPIVAQALPSYDMSEPVGEPFVFDFEVPVRPAPIMELNQTVEAGGVALTLERISDPPARPEARICYGSADTNYDWDMGGEEGPSNGVPGLGQRNPC